MSRIFATRSDTSRACAATLFASVRRSSGVSCSPASARVEDAPRTTASGVRRSCEIDASSVLRMRSVSASSASSACARACRRALSTSREITSATTTMIAKVSRYWTSSTVNVPRGGTNR